MVNGENFINKKRKTLYGYIRLAPDLNLPRPDRYELNDVDYEFLLDFNLRNSSSELEKEMLEGVIASFEIRSGKDTIITENEALEIIAKDVRERLKDREKEKELYKYWFKRREMVKRPLLRMFWKANPDDNNPHAAFRPRDKERMKLRRNSKPNDQEALLKFRSLHEEWR